MVVVWLEKVLIAAAGTDPVVQGLFGGLFITALNMVGALSVLVWRNPSPIWQEASLGFAAGVMLTASFTSLILPGAQLAGVGRVIAGIVIGVVFLDLGERWIPHLRSSRGQEGPAARRIQAVWLFILAITLHNLPEGLAVGIGFGSGDLTNAVTLMLAIGIQNIPEGLAVAVSALNAGMGSYFYAGLIGVRAGLVEIPLTLVGAWAVQYARPILPYAMGFAAGAMLYVIANEIIPANHGSGHGRLATIGTLLGVVLMLYLDLSLS